MSFPRESYATFARPCEDRDIPLIRELLTYDALALDACDLIRDEQGILKYRTLPSSLHWSRQTEWPWAIREAALEKHHTVLEAGGAGCMMKYPVAKRCRRVIVADINQEDMRHTDRAVDMLGFENITQVVGDVRSLPFPDRWFDRVFCISVLEHIPNGHGLAVKELARVLKPGGILLLTVDVVLDGDPGSGNNFYLNVAETQAVLGELGIGTIKVPSDFLRGRLEKEGVILGVVMAKYIKGE